MLLGAWSSVLRITRPPLQVAINRISYIWRVGSLITVHFDSNRPVTGRVSKRSALVGTCGPSALDL